MRLTRIAHPSPWTTLTKIALLDQLSGQRGRYEKATFQRVAERETHHAAYLTQSVIHEPPEAVPGEPGFPDAFIQGTKLLLIPLRRQSAKEHHALFPENDHLLHSLPEKTIIGGDKGDHGCPALMQSKCFRSHTYQSLKSNKCR